FALPREKRDPRRLRVVRVRGGIDRSLPPHACSLRTFVLNVDASRRATQSSRFSHQLQRESLVRRSNFGCLLLQSISARRDLLRCSVSQRIPLDSDADRPLNIAFHAHSTKKVAVEASLRRRSTAAAT